MGLLKLLLIQPSQNTGGDKTPEVTQIPLAHLSLRNRTSLISLIFNLDLGRYFEIPLGFLSDLSILRRENH
jgi:hypothetical protein